MARRLSFEAVISLAAAIGAGVAMIGCASEPAPVTRADYASALAAICTETTARLDELPQAPDQISVSDLATSAASVLDNEATRANRLEPPDDDQLDDDHRAFVSNTGEQADAWRAVADATADPAGDLPGATDLIRQLVAGRNELVDEMGVPDCRRDGL